MRWAAAALLAFLTGTSEPRAAEAKAPNIVLILADDLGYSDLGCYGGEIETPHLDGLASRGVRFTQFYNCARCCPTRASLLTGLYPHRAGVGSMNHANTAPGYQGGIHDQCVTLGDVLRSARYGTYMTGKWHVNLQKEMYRHKENWPRQRGFDRFYGTLLGYGSFFRPESLVRGNRRVDLAKLPEDFYYTDAISDTTVEFIDEHLKKSPERPFFCYVAYTAPHWPLHAKGEDIERYAGAYSAGWDEIRKARHERMKKLGVIAEDSKLTKRDARVPAWEELDPQQQAMAARKMAVYAAMVDSMDQGIGRILAKLRATDELDNTLILFLSDNGGCPENGPFGWDRQAKSLEKIGSSESHSSYGFGWSNVSNTPFREHKHWAHEGGTRAPMIVSWPARLEGENGLRSQAGHVIDVMPTFMEAAGADYPQRVEGREIYPYQGTSLLPALAGRPIEREALFWEHETNCAVRTGNWKLVAKERNGPDDPWELYDMEADPTETTNLAAEHPAKVAELAAMWNAWAEENAVLPLEKRPPWFYEAKENQPAH
jgi:arylsulfatase A-like enzyme